MEFSRRMRSEEGEECPIGRKDEGLRFLGFTMGVIYIDCLEKGKAVTGFYYAE